MRRLLSALPAILLAASCAALPEEPARGTPSPVPAILEGVPAAVVVDRALVDLDSGDPVRVRQARRVLLASASEDLEPVRARARRGAPGSPARLAALAILAERGEPLDDWSASEIVEMTLREIESGEDSGRATLLGLSRLRGMGDGAVEALRAASRPGSPRESLASRLLAILGGPARVLSEALP
jgi:hypothetical protein